MLKPRARWGSQGRKGRRASVRVFSAWAVALTEALAECVEGAVESRVGARSSPLARASECGRASVEYVIVFYERA
eukprot:3160329-Pleurochrysis_carterae.AAC.1